MATLTPSTEIGIYPLEYFLPSAPTREHNNPYQKRKPGFTDMSVEGSERKTSEANKAAVERVRKRELLDALCECNAPHLIATVVRYETQLSRMEKRLDETLQRNAMLIARVAELEREVSLYSLH